VSASATDRRHGLDAAEAARRLAAEGANELRPPRRHGFLAILREALGEPMLQLLLFAGIVYLAIGGLADALMLLAMAVLNIALVVVQEQRTERVLASLRDLTSPRALVIREGGQLRIPGREVVRGDLVHLEEGDRVPADARVLDCNDLELDESLLTGESVPVRKRAAAPGEALPEHPGGDGNAAVYAATMVVRGRGIGEVTATGRRSEIGKIGEALTEAEPPRPVIEREIRPIVRWIAVVAAVVGAAIVPLQGILRGEWLDGLLGGVSVAMSLLPQELPVVLSVFMALGAWRLSRRRVLTRRSTAIESLGAATVLCVDKTGTLTENRMSVARLVAEGAKLGIEGDARGELPASFHALVEFAVLASERDPFDPMERAFHALAERGLPAARRHGDWRLVHEYALSAELFAMSHVWQAPGESGFTVAAKGAPEAVAALCRLDAAARAAMAREVATMAEAGLRVLAVARAAHAGGAFPAAQHDFQFELLGLVGLADPLRPGVAAAIAECRGAGMRVVMITGDHPATARAIAGQAGLLPGGTLMTGEELARLDDAALAARIGEVAAFARTTPAQKLRIVEALKARGEIVAMTGDGVNDAPSLKAAHIGIAMGKRGTDVAREAASLVLLDDDFASIVAAARLGRRIFDNIGKAAAYVMAIHVPIAGLALFPLLLGWPIVLMPVHIVFLELVIDPVCSIVFEAEPAEPDIMRRPPRDPRRRFFGGARLGLSLLQGASVLAVLLAVLAIAARLLEDPDEMRALVFVTLVVANLTLILANRSWRVSILATLRRPNPALWWAVGTTLGVLALVLALAPLRALFHFAALHPDDLAICLAAGVASVLWFEILKRWRRPRAAPAE
jgi:Ca2+-transporting ATPase